MKSKFKIQQVGADALILYFPESTSPELCEEISCVTAAIEQHLQDELIDLIPSFTSLLLIFDPLHIRPMGLAKRIRAVTQDLHTKPGKTGKEVSLPVYYSTESGPDLADLARESGLSIDEVIALHSARHYHVYAIGFAPGFAYLGDVDERIARPRLNTPRTVVPRGAVAVANRQTAVYPASSPGGWNLIGLCPTSMFDPHAQKKMPVAVGDRVKFEPVDRDAFVELGGVLP